MTRVLLLWVNNHFTDFETDPAMMEQLERFEESLEREKMQGQLRMLNFACAAKARRRTLTLTRPSRDEPLHFSVAGGYERNSGIFVSRVERGSRAAEIGLKRGDQILEVNGQSFEHVTKQSRALEVLRGVCHLSITVKSNLLAFNEMQSHGSSVDSDSGGSRPGSSTSTHYRSRGKSVGSSDGAAITNGISEQSAHSGSEGTLAGNNSNTREAGGGSRDGLGGAAALLRKKKSTSALLAANSTNSIPNSGAAGHPKSR